MFFLENAPAFFVLFSIWCFYSIGIVCCCFSDRMDCLLREYYAERQGIETKSSHKIRKTYASKLNANGVPLDAIREQLGHADLSTTLSYIYNPLTEKDACSLISGAL